MEGGAIRMANSPGRNRIGNRIMSRWRRVQRLRRAWFICAIAAVLILGFNAVTGFISQHTISPVLLGELAGLLFGIPVGVIAGHLVFEMWNRAGLYNSAATDAAPISDEPEEMLDMGEVGFQ
jgi:hypothetical protein